MEFWNLSGSKSTHVSTTLFRILADFLNTRVSIVSIRPCILKSFSPFINPLVTVPRTPIENKTLSRLGKPNLVQKGEPHIN